jgi:hypothetical protein
MNVRFSKDGAGRCVSRFSRALERRYLDIPILIAAKAEYAKLQLLLELGPSGGPSRIGVEKSASHHLSQDEIAGGNPVPNTYSGTSFSGYR